MKIIFAATPPFAIAVFEALLASKHQIIALYTQPDRPAGRGRKIVPSLIKEFALQNKIPVFQPQTFKDPKVVEEFSALNADVLVDVACGLLLPKTILATPRFGCINIHPSLLPRWRGAAPVQRALMTGDAETGVTIMQMDEGLDTGPIYKQENFPINNTDTAETIINKAMAMGSKLLLEVLAELENGVLKPIPQNDAFATYANKLSKEEAKINWQLSANEIERNIRAFLPWPVAYTEIANKTVRIFQAEVIYHAHAAEPGTIVAATKWGIDVATGNHILRLHKIQLPGGKVLEVKDILNSHADLFTCGKKF